MAAARTDTPEATCAVLFHWGGQTGKGTCIAVAPGHHSGGHVQGTDLVFATAHASGVWTWFRIINAVYRYHVYILGVT